MFVKMNNARAKVDSRKFGDRASNPKGFMR